MRTLQHQIQRSQRCGDLLVELAATAIAFAVIALAARLFCWSFYIPYHWRYSVGAILATVMLKWIVPNLQRK